LELAGAWGAFACLQYKLLLTVFFELEFSEQVYVALAALGNLVWGWVRVGDHFSWLLFNCGYFLFYPLVI